ncbi:DUF6274 family protein [Streptomyces xiaopingdaonensis]|uniref:DUF6274 family protein n=1 Tax=Streptomyces xiaopingdaonensis TaxID=1565415 RepID=UPI001ED93B1E|nr:DUF6274 family protein [Streptomyces xiaopingdaonensis]
MPKLPGGTPRDDTRALLRAHLAARRRHRHLTRHCPACHRLFRLALDAPRAITSGVAR